MKSLETRRRKLLRETVSFFNFKNRCIDAKLGKCFYYKRGKAGCAIGRLIEDKKICRKMDKIYGAIDNNDIFSLLPENLKELGQNFLIHIQELHDLDENWNSEGDKLGLSKVGKESVKKIKVVFKL